MVTAETANIRQAKVIRAQGGKKKVGGAEEIDSCMELSLQLRIIPQDNLKLALYRDSTHNARIGSSVDGRSAII